VVPRFHLRRPLLIGCGLVFLQQITGQPSVLYYAQSIFKAAGFGSGAALQPVYVGCAKLVFTLAAVGTVERLGRRVLLFVGITVQMCALILLGISFQHTYCKNEMYSVQECYKACTPPSEGCQDFIAMPDAWGVVSVASLIMYVAGYQFGFGPVAWLMISEIFPLESRGSAMSIAAVMNFGMNILVTISFKDFMIALGESAAFWVYAALCALSLAFVKFVVIETKGMSLEDIQDALKQRLSISSNFC